MTDAAETAVITGLPDILVGGVLAILFIWVGLMTLAHLASGEREPKQ